jgi:SAM-dependent methyltransferase
MKVASYRERFRKFGVDPRSLKWVSRKAAEQRYQEIASLVEFKNKSILDIGCGFGEIIPFILPSNGKLDYLGIDKVAEFIGAASKKYPKNRFIVGDYFSKPLKKKFDIIIANGCLNANVRDNLGFRKRAIKVMFEHSNEAVIFNMSGGADPRKTAKRSNVWFASASEILRFCKTLTPKIIFRDHPARREFTAVLSRG